MVAALVLVLLVSQYAVPFFQMMGADRMAADGKYEEAAETYSRLRSNPSFGSQAKEKYNDAIINAGCSSATEGKGTVKSFAQMAALTARDQASPAAAVAGFYPHLP